MKLLVVSRPPSRQRMNMSKRHGITLIELMIAVVLTLVIIAAMIRAFKASSDQITIGRAAMDMHNQLRSVVETLRSDLQNATCVPRVRGINDERSGYFEYVEGFEHDHDHFDPLSNSYLGDHDDILALTVRSTDRPFRGRYYDETTMSTVYVESYLAEVVWWAVYENTNGNVTAPPNSVPIEDYGDNVRLYRRVLLIRPDLATSETNFDTFYAGNDVSVRRDLATGDLVMNSLEDLSDRKNRFAHDTSTFPHEFIPGLLDSRPLTGDFEGEDLMLAWATSFDIKVFSPNTTVFLPDGSTVSSIGQVVEPTDPGYGPLETAYPPGANPGLYPAAGGYVDLGHTGIPNNNEWFDGAAFENGYTFANYPFTYCTWTAAYESDGVSQDGDALVDEGLDGLDNDNANGVDDNLERETQPPYPYPIRSIQVTVRMIETKTNQVIQKSVKESFVPN